MPSNVRKVKVRSKRKIKRTRKKKVTLKILLKNRQKKIRLVLLSSGLILILASFYSSYKNSPPKTTVSQTNQTGGETLSTSFSSEPVTVDEKLLDVSKSPPRGARVPIRIVIPSLNIDLPVKEAEIVDGYWEVFSDSAGFGSGSAFPGTDGNQVIFAHARQNLFAPLKDIKTGDTVIVMTEDNWYSYVVNGKKEVLPSQTEVIAPTEDPILTLYTCSGYADSKRLIVTALLRPTTTP